MQRALILASGLLVAAAPAAAQPPPPGQPLTLSASIQRGYNNIKMNVTQSADKLSDADYGFQVGSMPETRTFGQLFAHIAQSQFGTCSAVKSVPNPVQGQQLEQTLKTKAEVTKALADSFAFCDDAFSSLTDQTALRDDQAGAGRDCPCRGPREHGVPQQRDVRDERGLPAHERHRAALDRARLDGTRRRARTGPRQSALEVARRNKKSRRLTSDVSSPGQSSGPAEMNGCQPSVDFATSRPRLPRANVRGARSSSSTHSR